MTARDSSALVLALVLSGLPAEAQPPEPVSSRGGRYTMVVEGFDWGAGVSKLILAVGAPVPAPLARGYWAARGRYSRPGVYLADKHGFCILTAMQTTLRIDDETYREAKAEAARRGVTLTRFIEDALRQRIALGSKDESARRAEIEERNRLMEALLVRTARFRVGRRPTRGEMNER